MAKLDDWLIANDERLLALRAGAGEALQIANRELGGSLRLEDFEKAAERVCLFWRKFKIKRFTTKTALNEKEWGRIGTWAHENPEALRRAKQLETLALMMVADGITANPTLLSNSVSFMDCLRRSKARELVTN